MTATRFVCRVEVALDDVERWWPHTHGAQRLYPVVVTVSGHVLDAVEVGFRTVEVDREDGALHLRRSTASRCSAAGRAGFLTDPVSYHVDDAEIERLVDLARRGGMNMLRVPGGTVYEDERFFDACDRAGILVWQDAMLGLVDPPDDEAFPEVMVAEVTDVLGPGRRPRRLAVFCGGQELEEQPAMFGLSRERWTTPIIHDGAARSRRAVGAGPALHPDVADRGRPAVPDRRGGELTTSTSGSTSSP